MSNEDILIRLDDLHRQATEERLPYYVGKCVREAMDEITGLRHEIAIGRRMLSLALKWAKVAE